VTNAVNSPTANVGQADNGVPAEVGDQEADMGGFHHLAQLRGEDVHHLDRGCLFNRGEESA